MSKKKIVETSREAFYSLDPQQLIGLRKVIFDALGEIGSGHYEDIARRAGIEPNQCWKRLSELLREGLIHRTGDKKMLSSKRNGFVWAPGGTPEPIKKKERIMKGKTVQDFSRAINQAKPSNNVINRLF